MRCKRGNSSTRYIQYGDRGTTKITTGGRHAATRGGKHGEGASRSATDSGARIGGGDVCTVASPTLARAVSTTTGDYTVVPGGAGTKVSTAVTQATQARRPTTTTKERISSEVATVTI